jgi:hypothetical protein
MQKAIGRDARSNWKICEKQERVIRSNRERYKSQMRETREATERCVKAPRKM